MSDSLLHQIALSFLPKIGPVLARTLVSYCGGVEAVFQTRKRQLEAIPGIGPRLAKTISSKNTFQEAERELTFINQNNVTPLFYLDTEYPARLKNYNDSPILLYYKGQGDLNAARVVSIVGTRKPSVRGISACEQIVEGLKPYGVTVVSGLAYGIDICAHKKCLDTKLPTIGVMGNGLGMIYPSTHRRIAESMQQNGGLLTEYSFRMGPEKVHFPMRNRIIAALCDALIVIETGRSGGSIISAQLANGYSKNVFAYPGRPSDKQSAGCNHLIKSHQALLMESSADIAYVMCWEEADTSKGVQRKLFPDLNPEEQAVMDVLYQKENLDIDKICELSGYNLGRISSILLSLEIQGLVKSLPGKIYTSV